MWPSDLAISPSVAAPTKSLRHRKGQRRDKSAKGLSYGEILPKPNPEDVNFWSTKMPGVNCIQFGTIFFLHVSGLFAILFISSDQHLYARDFRKWIWSNINETRGEITRTIDFAHFGLAMSKNMGAEWKIKDFPNPCGWPTNISSASCCKSIWTICKIRSHAKTMNSTLSAILFTMIWQDNLCPDLCPTKICGQLCDWLRLTKESSHIQPCLRGRSMGSFPEQRLVIEPICKLELHRKVTF